VLQLSTLKYSTYKSRRFGKNSHKWSLILVVVEERPGSAQFSVVLVNKISSRYLSLGGA